MKLLFSPTSPYARKARVVAIEKGLDRSLELVTALPWAEPNPTVDTNPLGKVPALVTDDGLTLYDSPVICEYLDSLAPQPRLIPAGGRDRWLALRMQALADGILDAAVSIVLERRRPEIQQSAAMTERALAAIRRALAQSQQEVPGTHAPLHLGHLSLAIALGYLEFRLPDTDLGMTGSALEAWWHQVRARPSLAATVPVA
jgi:glutathione S-transferase